jgi:hypothetical protein
VRIVSDHSNTNCWYEFSLGHDNMSATSCVVLCSGRRFECLIFYTDILTISQNDTIQVKARIDVYRQKLESLISDSSTKFTLQGN